MNTFTTDFKHLNHQDLCIQYDEKDDVKKGINFLVKYFEESISKGVIFKVGETIQYGWMILRIENYSDNLLTLWEPDMLSFPIYWVRDVSNTIMQFRIQKYVAESVGLVEEIEFPSIANSVITCNRRKGSNSFFLDRAQHQENDSGWFIGCTKPECDHNDPSNLSRISLYQAFLDHPELMMFYALPANTKILYSNEKSIKIYLKNRELYIKKDSFLDVIARQL